MKHENDCFTCSHLVNGILKYEPVRTGRGEPMIHISGQILPLALAAQMTQTNVAAVVYAVAIVQPCQSVGFFNHYEKM